MELVEVQLEDHPLLVAVDDKVVEEELSKEEEEQKPKIVEKDRILSILIVSHGTRGDVEHYVSFAEEVVSQQGKVALCSNCCSFLKSENSKLFHKYYELEGDLNKIMNSEQFKKAIYEGGSIDQTKLLLSESEKYMEKNMRKIWAAVKDFKPDALISGVSTLSECLAIAQKIQIPLFFVTTSPTSPTSEFPPPSVFTKSFEIGLMNKLLYWGTSKVIWTLIGSRVNKFREELHLPPQSELVFEHLPQFLLISENILQRASDWPSNVYQVGFWTRSAKEFTPSPALSAFLAAGDPPVYFGFGSTPLVDISSILKHIMEALEKLNMRGIICSQWDTEEMLHLPPYLFHVESVPHEWLFPQCHLVVHHGGGGTTAASLRAGIPTVIFPLLLTQPYWANKVAQLGVGPSQWISLKEMSASTLEQQIRSASALEVKAKAKAVSDLLRAEEPVKKSLVIFRNIYKKTRNCGLEMRWMKNEETQSCLMCQNPFTLMNRKHHCRSCGNIYCLDCLALFPLPNWPNEQMICRSCFDRRSKITELKK